MSTKLKDLKPQAVIVIGHHGLLHITRDLKGVVPVVLDWQGSMREPLDRPDQRFRNMVRYYAQQAVLRETVADLWGALVVSEESAEELQTLRSGVPTFVVPCACRASFTWPEHQRHRSHWRHALGLGSATFLLGYSGSLKSYQKTELMFRVLDELVRNGIDAALLLCTTDASEAERLCGQLDDRVRTRVHIRSFRDGGHFEALAAADVGLLLRDDCPTNWSAFPNKADEYWATGLPIVTNSALRPVARLVQGSLSLEWS